MRFINIETSSDGYVCCEGEQRERFYRKGKVVNIRTFLTVRKRSGTNYDKIGTLDPDENVDILEKSRSLALYRIQYF
ncbi:MAG: hypothetical protein E6094_14500 [Clostridium perfringens]|nr:hypothetical protein [Clostridium perfringens]